MKLNVLERIILMNLLPKEENYMTYKIFTDLKSELSFSEKEYIELGMEQSNNMINWKKNSIKDVLIGDVAKRVIKDVLEKLDADHKINDQNASLYEKFVLETESTMKLEKSKT